jgi:hypothetical protein
MTSAASVTSVAPCLSKSLLPSSMHVPPKKSEKTRLAKRFLTPAPHENSARNLLEGAGAKAAYVAGSDAEILPDKF